MGTTIVLPEVSDAGQRARLCSRLIPSLQKAAGVEFCLTDLVAAALSKDPAFPRRDPAALAAMIDKYELERNAAFSYGGWMEDRR